MFIVTAPEEEAAAASAVSVLQVIVAAEPNNTSYYSFLASYAYKAHNTRVGDLAATVRAPDGAEQGLLDAGAYRQGPLRREIRWPGLRARAVAGAPSVVAREGIEHEAATFEEHLAVGRRPGLQRARRRPLRHRGGREHQREQDDEREPHVGPSAERRERYVLTCIRGR